MNWIQLTSQDQLDELVRSSTSKPQVIFKHSTRCSISIMIKSRLEREIPPADINFFYLDLLQYRSISNTIADLFKVVHESPQILVIKNGQCTYTESQHAITLEEISEQV